MAVSIETLANEHTAAHSESMLLSTSAGHPMR